MVALGLIMVIGPLPGRPMVQIARPLASCWPAKSEGRPHARFASAFDFVWRLAATVLVEKSDGFLSY